MSQESNRELVERVSLARQQMRDAAGQTMSRAQDLATGVSNSVQKVEKERAKALAIAELIDATAGVVDDLMNMRNGDAWSTSFGFLANLALANLASANARGDLNAQNAMLINFYALQRALREQLVEDRLPLHRWAGAITALGPAPSPVAVKDARHPHAGSLQRHFRTVRDSGLALSGLQEFFALSGTAIYAIRPA